MSTSVSAMRDSATMLRRNLRHALRYPALTISTVGTPVFMLLLFVGIFGNVLGTGLGDAARGGGYVDYIAPGIIVMSAGLGSVGTAITVCTDMTDGIINRFRTMAISRASVLTGHVVGSMIQTMASIGLVIAVALLMGFRPTAGPVEWVAAIGLLALVILALTWLAVPFGLLSRNPEAASNVTLPFSVLPFVSSAFVPTDSMPVAVRWFAEYQPFTPVIETIRGLLTGAPVGNDGIVAVTWCLALGLAGYLWAKQLFRRDPTP